MTAPIRGAASLCKNQESSRQFLNPLVLAQPDSLLREEFLINGQRGSPCLDQLGGCQRIHAPRSDQSRLRQSSLQGSNVVVATQGVTWKHPNEVRTRLPRSDYLTRCQAPRNNHSAFFGG